MILIVVGSSLALWIRIRVQNGKNEIASTCISLEIDRETEGDAITLEDAFPIIDEDADLLDGYNFTIVNGCPNYIAYKINLESLTSVAVGDRIPIEHIKAMIIGNPAYTLNYYDTTTSLLDSGASYDARTIDEGYLAANESREFTLKLWLDENTPKDYMEHEYEAKVTVYGEISNYNPQNFVTYLTNLNSDELVYDDAIDSEVEENNNLRYVGKDPNNYVSFNGELWRVIGVMKDVDGGTVSGDNATRVKIIKATDIGHFPYYEDCLEENMTYDSTTDKWTCSSRRYNNNWPNSTANEILNDLYWNRKTHVPYNGWMYLKTGDQTAFTWQDYKTESLDFRNSGLKKVYQNMMETATYYLGGYTWGSDTYSGSTMNSKQYYTAERTNQGNNNELTWTGNLGLMYPSDYGYASSGTVSGSSCRNIALYTWNTTANAPCRNNDWLFNDAFWQWTMTPRAGDTYSVARVYPNGSVDSGGTNNGFGVRPVAYLKSSVKVLRGVGSQSNPFVIAL